MNDSPKHETDDDEVPEFGRAVDRHFYRAKVIISAAAVAVTVGLALANLVDSIQRDIHDYRLTVEHNFGELNARVNRAMATLEERGFRIGNLESQVYELKSKPTSRPDPFTGTQGKRLEQRIEQLEQMESTEHTK